MRWKSTFKKRLISYNSTFNRDCLIKSENFQIEILQGELSFVLSGKSNLGGVESFSKNICFSSLFRLGRKFRYAKCQIRCLTSF